MSDETETNLICAKILKDGIERRKRKAQSELGASSGSVAAWAELARLYEQDATYAKVVHQCRALNMSQLDTLAVALVAKARECQSYKHAIYLAAQRDGTPVPKVEWELPNI